MSQLSSDDLNFVRQHAPHIPLIGGLGAEIWRPGGIEESIRHIQVLDKLGYSWWGFMEQTQSWTFRSMWNQEPVSHELPDYEAFYDTTSLIAALGQQTKNIRLTLTTDCYRRPPSIMAQTLKTLDQITKGRVGVFVGTGENKQFKPHGLERTLPRLKRLEEYVRVLKGLLRSTDPVTLEGEFWPQQDALISCPVFDASLPPPVYIVGGGPKTMEIIGRVADGLGTYLPGAYANKPEDFAADLAIMRAEAERVGRDPASILIGAWNVVVLCETEDEVAQTYKSPFVLGSALTLTPTGKAWEKWGGVHPLGEKYSLNGNHLSTRYTQAELEEIFKKIPQEAIDNQIFIGTPEQVAARVVPWLQVMGYSEIPLGFNVDFGATIFPAHRQLAEDGLPRWHKLQLRFQAETNRLLKLAASTES